jgi:hypothetical protein
MPIGEGSRTEVIDFTIVRNPERGHDWNPIYISEDSHIRKSARTPKIDGTETALTLERSTRHNALHAAYPPDDQGKITTALDEFKAIASKIKSEWLAP